MITNISICFDKKYDFNKLNFPYSIYVNYIDMGSKNGKSEGWRLKSSWASIQNPFIACYDKNKVIKCFYKEAYKTEKEMFNDFIKYLNEDYKNNQ